MCTLCYSDPVDGDPSFGRPPWHPAPRPQSPVRPLHPPCEPSRRGVLAAGILAAGSVAGVLSGCGVHLEDDAPPIPVVPTRTVDPRAIAVARELTLVRLAGAAARAAGATGVALASSLATLHTEQEWVLAARVRELAEDPDSTQRLPADPSDASGSAGSGEPAWPASEALGLRRDGGRLGEGTGLAEVPADELPLVLAVRVQRAVGSAVAGVPSAPPPPAATASPAEAARLAGAARSALYGLEVAEARAPGDATIAAARAQVVTMRQVLDGLPGGDAPPPALGYELPFPIPDASATRRLAVHVLHGLTAAVVAGAGAAAGQEPALASLLGWAAQAEGSAVTVGGGLRAFPGLHDA